jgi:CTP synthase (UTP-ammonia lyase)
MNQDVRIGIIGDFNENLVAHKATNEAIQHAANHLSVRVNTVWLPTPSFPTEESREILEQFDAIWASPGSPYQSFNGAIKGIQMARELDKPFIGT